MTEILDSPQIKEIRKKQSRAFRDLVNELRNKYIDDESCNQLQDFFEDYTDQFILQMENLAKLFAEKLNGINQGSYVHVGDLKNQIEQLPSRYSIMDKCRIVSRDKVLDLVQGKQVKK